MKILPTLKTCEELDCEDLQPLNLNSPLGRMMKAMVEVVGKHPDLQDVRPMLSQSDYPHLEFPSPGESVAVDVYLCSTLDEINGILDRDVEGCLGVFATSSGFFDREKWSADQFRVLVACDEGFLREYMGQEAADDLAAGFPARFETYLTAFLITITHELAHAVEFISHGAGMTPEEIESAYCDGSLDLSVADVCSGRGIRKDMVFEMEDEEADAIMEARVEAQGIQWCEWALDQLPPQLIKDCVRAYAPRQRQSNLEPDSLAP